MIHLSVECADDVSHARREARRLAVAAGFNAVGVEELSLAVSELGTNLLRYARNGRLRIEALDDERPGIAVTSEDDGPGIPDIALAMQDGFSTGGGLGGGLGGVRRLTDDLQVESTPAGTRIVARKWRSA